MNNKILRAWLLFLLAILTTSIVPPLSAQPDSTAQPTAQQQKGAPEDQPLEEGPQPGHVMIGGYQVVTIYDSILGRSPEDRAAGIEQRIINFAKDRSLSPDAIELQSHESWTEIYISKQPIMAVTDVDARMAGATRARVATEYASSIQQSINTYRREHSWPSLLRGVLKTGLLTVILLPTLWLVRRLRLFIRARVQQRIKASAEVEQKTAFHLSMAYVGPVLLGVGAIIRWLIILALIEIYLTVTLGFFPFTREISVKVSGWVLQQLSALSEGTLRYLPNLIVLGVIALVVYYLLRLIRLVSGEIASGNLKIQGFYPDWAGPTEKLVRVLLLVLTLIVAFPYLPGSRSPAFQGISIFLGLLLSLGSSSAVANAIAGIILTYMRSFLVGDWVQIGDTLGEVTAKTLLVTRVLTPKAEIITIPNSTVMSGSVKNYSAEARKLGVILYTSVTIGYDTPWRTVHQLLINAALDTPHVLQQPAPFVLQRALNDFYVCYELNIYTDTPREVLSIFSDLHRNIQDKFNDAGVEICSPHFSSLRDGNTIAIPENYIPGSYKTPGFRLDVLETGKENRRAAPDALRGSAKAD